jgi:hypothetical protein
MYKGDTMEKGIYTAITNDKVDLAIDILNHEMTHYRVQDVINMYSSPNVFTLNEIISGSKVLYIEVTTDGSNPNTFLNIFDFNSPDIDAYSEDYSARVTPEQLLEGLNELIWERGTHG